MSLPEYNISFNFTMLQSFTSILGKHQFSYLANFTSRQHLCVPTKVPCPSWAGAPSHELPTDSSTEPYFDERTTSPKSPFTTSHGEWATYLSHPKHLRLLMHGRRATHSSLHPCLPSERWAPSPAPSPFLPSMRATIWSYPRMGALELRLFLCCGSTYPSHFTCYERLARIR